MARPIQKVVEPQDVREGTGAHMRRLFPSPRFEPYDPFVLLDEFFVQPGVGLPDHPHKGFEIITYMLGGGLHHRDSLGVDHVARAGGLMRISCGRGIIHSEYPAGDEVSHGLQLWVNLARAQKQLEPSFDQREADEVQEERQEGVLVRHLAGGYAPVRLETPILYLHVRLDPGQSWRRAVPPEYAGFLYFLDGTARVGPAEDPRAGRAGQGLFFDPATDDGARGAGHGAAVRVVAGDERGADFALIAGRPHGEPIRLRGPFVL